MSRQQIVGGLIKGLWKEAGTGEMWGLWLPGGRWATVCWDWVPPQPVAEPWGEACYCLLDQNTSPELLGLGEGRRLRIWSEMAGLLQDQPCQIQTDITHRQILNPVRRKETFCVRFCSPLIRNDVFCQPKIGCYSDATWDFCSQASWLGEKEREPSQFRPKDPPISRCFTQPARTKVPWTLPTCNQKCQQELQKAVCISVKARKEK